MTTRYVTLVRTIGPERVNYVYIQRPKRDPSIHHGVGFWSTRRLLRAVRAHGMVIFPALTNDGYSALERQGGDQNGGA